MRRSSASHYRAARERRRAAAAQPPVYPLLHPARLPERAWVERFVVQHTGAPLDPNVEDLRPAIVDWICATGDCLLHAVYEVRKARGMPAACHGACCQADARWGR